MSAPPFGPKDVPALREAAAELVARLGLRGYDNASITAVDAWVDSPEFQENFRGGGVKLAYLAGAYLGEAVIRRHGGRWVDGGGSPHVSIDRNGLHLVNPFGKVQKRATLGPTENLLALVNLVAHVTTGAKPEELRAAAAAALAKTDAPQGGGSSGVFLLLLALLVFPIVVLVVAWSLTDWFYGSIAGGVAIPVGFGLLIVVARLRGRPSMARAAVGSLAWEAELSLPPLLARLEERLMTLRGNAHERELEELRFYTEQVAEVRAIVAENAPTPGRGYVGFDPFGASSSWAKARLG